MIRKDDEIAREHLVLGNFAAAQVYATLHLAAVIEEQMNRPIRVTAKPPWSSGHVIGPSDVVSMNGEQHND